MQCDGTSNQFSFNDMKSKIVHSKFAFSAYFQEKLELQVCITPSILRTS